MNILDPIFYRTLFYDCSPSDLPESTLQPRLLRWRASSMDGKNDMDANMATPFPRGGSPKVKFCHWFKHFRLLMDLNVEGFMSGGLIGQ